MNQMKKLGAIFVIISALGCNENTAFALEGETPLDVSLACGQTSPLIGKSFELTTRSHGVSGTVQIVDDCTISIHDFNYDGKGLQVEIYSAVKGDFTMGQAISQDLLRPTKPYVNEKITLRLPQTVTVDTLEGISIWCSDVSVSFGDVLFGAI